MASSSKPMPKRITRSSNTSPKVSSAASSIQSGRLNGPQAVLEQARSFYEKLYEFDKQRNEIHKERREIVKNLADSEVNLMMKIKRLRRIKKLQTELKETTKMKEKLDRFDEERRICVICLCFEREYACIPCGHFAVCGECMKEITVCPMCNTEIREQIKIYIP